MRKDARCSGCKYNTPKSRGGVGRVCNGFTMSEYDRCPEWVVNEYLKTALPVYLKMSDCINYNRVKGVPSVH
jgi:hypothetical protein